MASLIASDGLELLDAPVRRVGATFTPVGFNRILERAILPSVEKIKREMEGLCEY